MESVLFLLPPLRLMCRFLHIGYFWREPKACLCVEFYTLTLQVELIAPRLKPPLDARLGCLSVFLQSFGSKLAQVCMGALGISPLQSWSITTSAALAIRILGLVKYQLGNPSRFPCFLQDLFYGVEIIRRNSMRDVMCRILHIGCNV